MNLSPLFSVIIPTYHRNDLLAKCLDCLAPNVQTLPPDKYEVIVTDDGCETTAEQMTHERYRWAKWVAGPCKGPAANRNNGAMYAQGEWLAFTDDDCLPDPQWLENYAKAIVAHPAYLVFEGRTYVDRPRRSLAETSPINETGGYLLSCNFTLQKQLFESLAGFDERFIYAAMEDVDLRLRLTESGYKFYFVRTASVCHPWRHSTGWKALKQHNDSTFIYLTIHQKELSEINSRYYLFMVIRAFTKFTLPGILKFKAAGIKQAFTEHLAGLQMAYRLRNWKPLD